MATEDAWNLGAQIAERSIANRRQRKEQLSDEEFKLHATRLGDLVDSNRKLLATIDPKQDPSEYAAKVNDLRQNLQDIRELYHPDRHPDAVARFGHMITDKLGITDPQARIRKTAAASAGDEREAQALAAATPNLSPDAEAQQDSAVKLAYLRQAQKNYETLNPSATPEQKAQFFTDLMQSTYGITQKPSLKLYELPDKSKAWLDASRPDLIPPGSTAIAAGAAKVGLKFDTATGQVIDSAANKRYSPGDPSNPPEVVAMFQSADTFTRKKQEFQVKLAQTRATALGGGRPLSVLDTANENAPTYKTYSEMRGEPGRYLPAAEGDKSLTRENFIQDIMGSSQLTREAITNLKEDFPEEMKVKIALAMRAGDPHAALDQLVASGALGTLSDDQWNFLVATRQLAEQAMAMRTTLGAGQGSDQVRAAIEATLPSLLTPDKAKALAQLDAFDKTLARLRRGIPKVPLRTDVGGGGAAGGDMITMKLPDGRTGTIHRLQKEQFIHDHPGAVEVTQ